MDGARRTWAVVLAGGLGLRVGADRPKQLLDLGGRSVLQRSLAVFLEHPAVDHVVLVVPSAWRAEVLAHVGPALTVVDGGRERHDSTRAALAAVRAAGAADTDRVLVHDAARPLVTARIVSDVVASLDTHDVVAVLVPTSDTIVQVDPDTGLPSTPLPRATLRRHQTPQGFAVGVLDEGHRRALLDPDLVVTDDCTLVSTLLPDVSVGVVEGDPANLKITDATDLVVAQALLVARG